MQSAFDACRWIFASCNLDIKILKWFGLLCRTQSQNTISKQTRDTSYQLKSGIGFIAFKD